MICVTPAVHKHTPPLVLFFGGSLTFKVSPKFHRHLSSNNLPTNSRPQHRLVFAAGLGGGPGWRIHSRRHPGYCRATGRADGFVHVGTGHQRPRFHRWQLLHDQVSAERETELHSLGLGLNNTFPLILLPFSFFHIPLTLFLSISSRAMGPETGGSMGLLFYAAYAVGVAFYIIGFATAVQTSFFPVNDTSTAEWYRRGIGSAGLFCMLLISLAGAGFFAKFNIVFFIVGGFSVFFACPVLLILAHQEGAS